MKTNYCAIKDLKLYISDGNYSEKYPRNDEFVSSGIPFLRANNISHDTIIDKDLYYITDEKHQELLKGHVRTGDILLTTRGNIGQAAIVPNRHNNSNINAQIVLLRVDREEVDNYYLLYALQSEDAKRQYDTLQTGTALKQLPIGRLMQVKVNIPEIAEQRWIANIIKKCNKLIFLRKQQLKKLDELVKVRFVEMFGDVTVNNKGLLCKSMVDVCEIIDGDRGKNYPKQEDFFSQEYCLFLNTKNVTISGFNFDECSFITKEKDESLRKGKLRRSDIVLTTRGTIGNLAFYDEQIPYDNIRINSGMVILRMNRIMIAEIFFIEQFKMLLQEIKREIASGSAQPQLPISTMKNIKLVIPELKEQEAFSAFVKQINKSKLSVQKSLEKLETLKKALMQKYFG